MYAGWVGWGGTTRIAGTRRSKGFRRVRKRASVAAAVVVAEYWGYMGNARICSNPWPISCFVTESTEGLP